MVDPVYNIKAIRGMLHEMVNNPGRFKGHKILYIHTGKYNKCDNATLILQGAEVEANQCMVSAALSFILLVPHKQ